MSHDGNRLARLLNDLGDWHCGMAMINTDPMIRRTHQEFVERISLEIDHDFKLKEIRDGANSKRH
jgi:hypothetical protein